MPYLIVFAVVFAAVFWLATATKEELGGCLKTAVFLVVGGGVALYWFLSWLVERM